MDNYRRDSGAGRPPQDLFSEVLSSCVETDWWRNVLRDYGKTGETGRGVKYGSRRNLGVACTAERTV